MNSMEMTCPKCNAQPGERCRSLKTGRTTDLHVARWDPEARKAYDEAASNAWTNKVIGVEVPKAHE